ncbi:MAG: HNH endonuclease [Actinomycetota bacterium]|nr:HNH endonuclease [Actinomycetota bacterium]
MVVDWERLRTATDATAWIPPPAPGHARGAPARLEGYGPICDTLLRKLACDAGVSRVVTDPAGVPLNLGRTARFASAAQRRGIRVRSGGRCETPGCDSTLVQLHHIVHWVDGGDTDLDQMVAACPRCHTMIHLGLLKVEAVGHGRFCYRDRTGRPLRDTTADAHTRHQHWLRGLDAALPTHAAEPETAQRRRLQLRM